MRFLRFSLLAILVTAHGISASSSQTELSAGQRQKPPFSAGPPEDENRMKLEKDMAKRANKERQAHLKQDADKLLALAMELKQYVDKTDENTLSLEVLKKSEEIEKLAHSVKEKMRGY